MLLLELSGALFQFDAREPAFDPLFQFAPNSGERSVHHPCSAPASLPGADHSADLSQMY